MLFDAGADINLVSHDGATPLFVAAFSGHIEIVRLFMDNGASFDTVSECGATPLFVAS